MTVLEKSHQSNILEIKGVRTLVVSKYFPLVLQIAALAVYIAVIYFGYFGVTEETRYSNFGSFIIWVIWWPALIFIALFNSRLWCTVCPIGFIASTLDKLGLNFQVPNALKKNKLAIVLGLFILHSLVVSYEISHTGRTTALYLALLFGYAILIALVFEPHSFCNHFCPLVGIVGTYSLNSPTELRSVDTKTCKTCEIKSCFRNCPAKIYMGNLEANEPCKLCFDCVKECNNQGNIRFSFRRPFRDLWGLKKDRLAYGMFTILLLGMMIEEVGEEWEVFEKVTTYIPNYLSNLGLPGSILGYPWLSAIWLNVILPLIIIAGGALVARIIWRPGSFIQTLKYYAIGFIPLVFSLHFTKLWHKFHTNVAYFPLAINDPIGSTTASQISQNIIAKPGYILWGQTSEGIFLLSVVIIGLIASIYAVYKISRTTNSAQYKKSAIPYYFTITATGLAFLFVIYKWFAI
jgi:polyferredoxin